MSADEAIETAMRIGLDGICFTEHDRAWEESRLQALREKHGFPVFRGVEVMVQEGIEVLVFGLDIDFATLLPLADLRQMVSAAGGFMVYAHPFRGLREPTIHDLPAALAAVAGRADPGVFDAVEGCNGRHQEHQNQLARDLASGYGLKATGGSDAHRVDEIGTCVTVFERRFTTDAALLAELKAGRFASARQRAREMRVWREDTRTLERRWL